jgi:hypothetical protein
MLYNCTFCGSTITKSEVTNENEALPGQVPDAIPALPACAEIR